MNRNSVEFLLKKYPTFGEKPFLDSSHEKQLFLKEIENFKNNNKNSKIIPINSLSKSKISEKSKNSDANSILVTENSFKKSPLNIEKKSKSRKTLKKITSSKSILKKINKFDNIKKINYENKNFILLENRFGSSKISKIGIKK